MKRNSGVDEDYTALVGIARGKGLHTGAIVPQVD